MVLSAVALVAAAIATRLVHVVLAFAIRRLSDKRLAGESTRWQWRIRAARSTEAGNHSVAELRRRLRIDATALALSRFTAIVIWLGAGVALLQFHGISVSVAIGSAGFIGLIVALGAQASVNDYVTGLHILLEDRFGEGDEVEVTTASGRQLRGVVSSHGMFSTRMVADGVVHHVANRHMSEVTNHTQLGTITVIECADLVDEAASARAVERAQQARPELPDLALDRVEAMQEPNGRWSTWVHVRSSGSLGSTDELMIAEELNRQLHDHQDRHGRGAGDDLTAAERNG